MAEARQFCMTIENETHLERKPKVDKKNRLDYRGVIVGGRSHSSTLHQFFGGKFGMRDTLH